MLLKVYPKLDALPLPGQVTQKGLAALCAISAIPGGFESASVLERIRLRLEHRAVARAELERMCSELRLPGDFDVARISWRRDYEPFFCRQLLHRARRIYLFRDEHIFEVEKAVVIETPQLGHATYVCAKRRSMDSFLALYTTITKDDIRRNRNNAAERLGLLGRVIHGTNLRAWRKEDRLRVGEGIDPATAIGE